MPLYKNSCTVYSYINKSSHSILQLSRNTRNSISSSLSLYALCSSLSDLLDPAFATSSDIQGLMHKACRAGTATWHGHQHVCVCEMNGLSPETLSVADIVSGSFETHSM